MVILLLMHFILIHYWIQNPLIFPKIDWHCLTSTVYSLYPTVNPLYTHCTELLYHTVLHWTAQYLPTDEHCTSLYTTVLGTDQHCTPLYEILTNIALFCHILQHLFFFIICKKKSNWNFVSSKVHSWYQNLDFYILFFAFPIIT